MYQNNHRAKKHTLKNKKKTGKERKVTRDSEAVEHFGHRCL